MRHLRGAADVVDGAKRVRGGAEGDQLGASIEAATEIFPIKLARFGNHLHDADGDAALFLERAPRGDVRVVI